MKTVCKEEMSSSEQGGGGKESAVKEGEIGERERGAATSKDGGRYNVVRFLECTQGRVT